MVDQNADVVADVIIVGAGVAGCLIAYELARAGISVAVLESGPSVDRGTAVAAFQSAIAKVPECPYPDVPYAPRPSSLDPYAYYVQDGPDNFTATYERRVGGTTWHWLGTTLRLHPHDFAMKSTYGVGIDWPVSYGSLETWYDRAEKELGVSGPGTSHAMPAIAQSYLDGRVKAAVARLGLEVTATPQARNSQPYDGRPPCCGNASCIPVCPIGAKYDGSVHAAKAIAAGARIVEQAVAFNIEVSGNGEIQAIAYKKPDGTSYRASGKFFVLAAHAIETPKLLLLARSAALPNGVANRSGQVGRNLADHPTQLSWALAKEPVYPYRGPLSTSGIENLRDGAFRNVRSAFRIEIGNDGWSWPVGFPTQIAGELIDDGLRGTQLAQALESQAERHVRLASLNEQLPNPNNRIEPAWGTVDALGIPRPRIAYAVDDYTFDGMAEARRRHDQIFDALGVTFRKHSESFQSAGHVMGTYRMGKDPKTSVADADGRAHDHVNLYLAGSGLFPTTGTANPTLTIAALALKTAAALQKSLHP